MRLTLCLFGTIWAVFYFITKGLWLSLSCFFTAYVFSCMINKTIELLWRSELLTVLQGYCEPFSDRIWVIEYNTKLD